MFKSFGEHAEGERLNAGDRVRLRHAIRERTRNLRHFGEPTTVGLLLNFDVEFHHDHQEEGLPDSNRTRVRCRTPYASAYNSSTNDFTAASILATFGFAPSTSQYSSVACAPVANR